MNRIFNSRRHHYLAIVSVLLIMVALIAGMMGCVPLPKEIHDWYDLDAVRDNLGGSYILANDLDSTTAGYEELASPTANLGKGWQPIMGNTDNKFTGSFDGQGYEIRDFYINRPNEDFIGLFGFVDNEGVIQDIGVVNATVTGEVFVGGLVGFTRGTVSNSYSANNVTGKGAVGGLVGWNIEGTISNSHATGSVTGVSRVGGLVGRNEDGTLSDSYSTGSATGSSRVGGLVGENYEGNVSNSYSTGSVSSTTRVGGLVGENSGYISNSHYNYDEVLINGENIITIGALFDEDFEEWLANGKFLDINDRLSQEDGYYIVNDITDFKQLLAFDQDDTLKFRLKNDLDLTSEPDFYIPYLAGEFDGSGHKISNLSFNFGFVHTVGLFGRLAPGGKVTDLAAENVNITGDANVGGLVGTNYEGTISNSYTTGSVTGALVGGLVGENNGTISDSYSTSSVTGGGFVGGLVGINEEGIVSNSYSTGNATGGGFVGGLVGINEEGIVSNSYSTGNTTGDVWVGGLVGINGHTVSNSYSTGSVTSGGSFVGGLVGENMGTISDSYSTSSVTGNSSVGGLVGRNDEGNVSNSYSTGNVTGVTYVGGLIGENEGEGTISNSYWNIETSGQNTSAGGTGLNTTEMKDIDTFSGATWNIIAVTNPGTRNPAYIWNIVDDATYPFLSWQP